MRSSCLICLRNRRSCFSSLASMSSVISSVTRKNRTFRPWPQAARPRAIARCVLPTPLEPMSSTFSRSSMYCPLASSSTRGLLIDGCWPKSNSSSVFVCGKRAALSRRSAARRSRSISSSSQSRCRYARWSRFSTAAREATFSHSFDIVGSLSDFRWCFTSTVLLVVLMSLPPGSRGPHKQ